MKSRIGLALFFAVFAAAAGCQKSQKADSDAIRDGIRQHLSSLNTLNLGAMDMNITNVKIDGNQAQADVEYVPKSGGAPGAGMRVTYLLEKRSDQWVVIKKSAMNGTIDHPTANTNPQVQPGDVHGNLPNFRDILPPANAGSASTPGASPAILPPGHPPVTTDGSKKP